MSEIRDFALFEKRIESESKLIGITIIKQEQLWRGGYRVKSAVDFSAGVDGRALFFDAKVTHERLWNLKRYCFYEKNIHQYAQILNASINKNKAGYLIHFKDYEQICWVPVTVIEVCRRDGTSSIHPRTVGIKAQADDHNINLRDLVFDES